MSATISRDLNVSLGDECTVEETVQSLVEIVEHQSERIGELEEQVDELEEEVESLREDSNHHAKERADVCRRVSALEESETKDKTPTREGEKTAVQETETPLEDVIDLPEEVVDDNLTANQERARFVAMDVVDYSRSVPAGRAIRSSDLRKVLGAKEESPVHTQTVSRVIEQLEQLGKDGVKVRKGRDGERRVVFSDEIVERIVALQRDHTVVSGEKVAGRVWLWSKQSTQDRSNQNHAVSNAV